MGNSIDWQRDLIDNQLSKFENLTVFNPRRNDWDSSWKQTMDEPRFVEQVNWELDHLEKSTIILFHFAPGTLSPISLLELGLFWDRNTFVHCPEGYLRKGNVDIVCHRYGVPMLNSIEEILLEL